MVDCAEERLEKVKHTNNTNADASHRVQAKIEVPTTTTINNKLETNRPSIRFGQHNHSATDYDYDDMGSDIGYA